MLRVPYLTNSLFLILLFASIPSFGQDPTKPVADEQPTPANLIGGLLGDSMQTQLTAFATGVMDGYLDYLGKRETAKKLATFQKNYYDALIEQGFTKDQAFELLLRFGNPLADGPRAGK